MRKIDTLRSGYVWLDIWEDSESRMFFEPYVVKRDGNGRSAKYTSDELLTVRELENIALSKYLLD